MESFFPHEKFLHRKLLQHIPSSQPLPPDRKIPLKTSLHFPRTITTCKHWSKFVTCSPSHGGWGGVSCPHIHSYKVFRVCWIMAFSEFWSVNFGKIISVEEGLCALQFFGQLKRALELFISVRMRPLLIF